MQNLSFMGISPIHIKQIFGGMSQVTSVTIPSADVLLLFTTAYTLVPAPTDGSYLLFLGCLFEYDFGTTAYTIGSATNLNVRCGSATGAALSTSLSVTGLLNQTADIARYAPATAGVSTLTSNAALVLTLAGANVTLGDGLLKTTVAYIKVPTKL